MRSHVYIDESGDRQAWKRLVWKHAIFHTMAIKVTFQLAISISYVIAMYLLRKTLQFLSE